MALNTPDRGEPHPSDLRRPPEAATGASPSAAELAWCDDGEMPTMTDLARRDADLTEAGLDWLHALVSDWQLLADLSFADLALWAPLRRRVGWVALAQMRPTT